MDKKYWAIYSPYAHDSNGNTLYDSNGKSILDNGWLISGSEMLLLEEM